MARLPSQGYLMQQIGGQVILFEDYTERKIVRFVASDGIAVASALAAIQNSRDLSDEDKCFACFWAGYFHAYSDRKPEMRRETYVTEVDEGRAVVVLDAGTEVVRFDPRDADATMRAQKNIYDCVKLSQDEKRRAYFWSGFFYALARVASPESPARPARPHYADLGVTDDEVASGDDFGKYDLPNLRGDA